MVNERIVALSHQLRQSGVNVSIRSTQTACQVWDLFKNESEISKMKTALKSVYVKEAYDEKRFDEIFDEIFENDDSYRIKPIDQRREDPAIQPEDIMGLPDGQQSDYSIESMTPPEFDVNQLRKIKVHEKDLLKTDISNINTFDERILDLCRKLSQKIRTRRSIRRKRMQSNYIDMPRTIRTNLKNGGKLIRLQNAKPHLHKNKHIFLSDVSGSCDWINNWFFTILYGCQKSFDKISCYEFDNSILETTDALKLESYYESYQNIYNRRIKNGMIHGQSDMANSFKEFLESANLNHRSIVIILSDCRDWNGKRENGELESAKILREIVRRSSKVLIFNPEPEAKWDTPTSCVNDYVDAGAKIYEIKNLENLATLITNL
ncbi:MAG: hypothetical protein BZ137_05025 [Methanosphaera sp. rholeuAM130]|nr:MAG: hypothetical protein BZ137_05025 [Methanosphaera sp. rholeuAM130]